jgi:hypothetical protein
METHVNQIAAALSGRRAGLRESEGRKESRAGQKHRPDSNIAGRSAERAQELADVGLGQNQLLFWPPALAALTRGLKAPIIKPRRAAHFTIGLK